MLKSHLPASQGLEQVQEGQNTNVSPFKEMTLCLGAVVFHAGWAIAFLGGRWEDTCRQIKKDAIFRAYRRHPDHGVPVIVIVGMYLLCNAYAILLVAVGIGAFLKKYTVKERGIP